MTAEDDDDDLYSPYSLLGTSSNGTRALGLSIGLSIITDRPFRYDGIMFNTAQNAFQAQKAPPDQRDSFAAIEPMDAVAKGRNCHIDVAAWDANREKLMTQILKAQAEDNETMRETLVEWKDADIVVGATCSTPSGQARCRISSRRSDAPWRRSSGKTRDWIGRRMSV